MSPDATCTDWFSAEVRPIHAGVYRRRWPGGPYTCWDGGQWRADAATPESAAAQSGESRHPGAAWQGLRSPSEADCATCKGHTVIDAGHDVETGEDLIRECPDC